VALDIALQWRDVAVFLGFASSLVIWELPPIFLQILLESEAYMAIIFWWEWFIVPTCKLLPADDLLVSLLPSVEIFFSFLTLPQVIFVIALVSVVVRWLVRFPHSCLSFILCSSPRQLFSKCGERVAKAKLEKRIKALEGRLQSVGD
jgi:hypothetical protein